MNKHLPHNAGAGSRLIAAVVTVTAVAASLALLATAGGAGSGGGSGGHTKAPSPAQSTRGSASSGIADVANPWTLNDSSYSAYFHVPANVTASARDLVIPDAERAQLLALIEAGGPFTQGVLAPARSSDMVIPNGERTQLLALIEAGVPFTADPSNGVQSGTGG